MYLRSSNLQKDFRLSDGATTTIGRLEQCDIVLDAATVTQQHLEVQVAHSKVMIRDLNSRNGTKVNDREIAKSKWVELQEGDRIQICGYDFRLIRSRSPGNESGTCIVDAGQVSLSVNRSRSFFDSQPTGGTPEQSQLRALLEVTNALRNVLRIEDVLERAVAILLRIFPTVDRAAIGFVHEGHRFEPKWWQLREGNPDDVIRISQTIVRHVTETAQAVITNDAQADFSAARSLSELPIRSVMVAPLINATDNVFGFIHVDASQPDRFTSLDLEVLAAIATQLALAVNFSRLHAQAVEDALLRHDVEQARAVQQRYLPTAPPQIAGYDIADFYRAARHVGGDYYDYIPLADGRIAIVLGDVIGKGVPAALTMVRLATETRASLEVCHTPGKVVTRLNEKLCHDFITLVVLILDPATNTVTISNAGHELPLLRRADGTVSAFGAESSGCPLSVVKSERYPEVSQQLAPGDSLVLFSDGFPDADNKTGRRRFGKEPIAKCLSESSQGAAAFIHDMVEQVDRFIAGGTQFDDMCMVCLRREG